MLLALARSMDETMHLRVLAHARRELGTQVNEGLLRGGRCSCGWASASPGPRPALPSPGPAPAPPCPHRAGPDPEVLLLHVLDILVDPTVAQHLGGGEKIRRSSVAPPPVRVGGREPRLRRAGPGGHPEGAGAHRVYGLVL